MHIIIFGANGDVGSRIVNEALRRGHAVTGVVRSKRKLELLPKGVVGHVLDANETDDIEAAIADVGLVVSALRPPSGEEAKLPALTQSILDAARKSKKRVLVVGGAANLLMPDDSGYTVLTAPDFLPESVKPIAAACFAQFRACSAADDVDWVYFSPPAMLRPGKRTGYYRRGSDTMIVDGAGNSVISMEDFAVAILDESEAPAENVRRLTVAY